MHADPMTFLREKIVRDVFKRGPEYDFVHPGNHVPEKQGWIFDFRAITMDSEVLQACATLFKKTVEKYGNVQICGLEIAAVPLVTGIAVHLARDGHPLNAIFIRKGRKKDGLMRRIEGNVAEGVPIILIDDICNSGKSFEQQIEVLASEGHRVIAVWSILRYRDQPYYTRLHERNIAMHTLFTLDDLSPYLPVKNLTQENSPENQPNPTRVWRYSPGGANMSYVLPKSRPCIDETRIYYGTDGGHFICLDQQTGSVTWKYRVGYSANGKSIFSSPLLSPDKQVVYFGAYDGNVYALDARTGKRIWVNFDADWIGSSPAVAADLNTLLIGTEFGISGKRGGLCAIDLTTGKTRWSASMPAYTHATPYYIERHQQVAIGNNDGVVRLYDAKKGTLLWSCKTGDPTPLEIASGFSPYDIKESCAYDEKLDAIFIGNLEGSLFCLDRKTGSIRWTHTAAFGFWATPLVCTLPNNETYIYASSLDKHIYCINAHTGALLWQQHLGARIFCAPTRVSLGGVDIILCGSNTGRLTALDPQTGKELWYITLPERIVNAPVFNNETKQLFIPTAANEIYRYDLSS